MSTPGMQTHNDDFIQTVWMEGKYLGVIFDVMQVIVGKHSLMQN